MAMNMQSMQAMEPTMSEQGEQSVPCPCCAGTGSCSPEQAEQYEMAVGQESGQAANEITPTAPPARSADTFEATPEERANMQNYKAARPGATVSPEDEEQILRHGRRIRERIKSGQMGGPIA